MPVFRTNDTRLYYRVEGNYAGKVILFHHSLGANLTLWDRHAGQFEDHHRIVRFDARGHGRSSVPEGPYDVRQFGHDTIALMDHLGIERFQFCGLSLGAMVGLWLAANAPHRIERILLAGASAWVANKEAFDKRLARLETEGLETEIDRLLERWFTPAYLRTGARDLSQIRDMVVATPPEGYRASAIAVRDFDGRPLLSRIVCPTLLLTGAEDTATPVGEAQEIARSVATARLVVIDEASHLAQVEQASVFDSHLSNFLV